MDRKEDMRVRTKRFASGIIKLFCSLPGDRIELQVVGKQLLRSGTSVAANYREASRARSRAEFISKIETCAQEADESMLWFELLQEDCKVASPLIVELHHEANELIAIFVTMAKNTKQNSVK